MARNYKIVVSTTCNHNVLSNAVAPPGLGVEAIDMTSLDIHGSQAVAPRPGRRVRRRSRPFGARTLLVVTVLLAVLVATAFSSEVAVAPPVVDVTSD